MAANEIPAVEVVFTRAPDSGVWRPVIPGAMRDVTDDELTAIRKTADNDRWPGVAIRVVLAAFPGTDNPVRLHSMKEPAVVLVNGTTNWYQCGKRHRDGDLPAIENPAGGKFWYQEGRLHRDAGPAYWDDLGVNRWFCKGVDATRSMEEIFKQLAVGGRLLTRGSEDAAGGIPCWVVSLDGDIVSREGMARAGWYDWVLEHRDEHFPELAAAMRAAAMQETMREAGLSVPPRRPRNNLAV